MFYTAEPWELGALVLGIVDPSAPTTVHTPRQTIANLRAASASAAAGGAGAGAGRGVGLESIGSGGAPGIGSEANGARGPALASPSSARAGRHHCLAVQQLLLKGLAPSFAAVAAAMSATSPAESTQVLTLRALRQLALIMARHGSISAERLAGGSGSGSGSGRHPLTRSAQRGGRRDLGATTDQTTSPSLTTLTGVYVCKGGGKHLLLDD